MKSELLPELFSAYKNIENAIINLPNDPPVVRQLFIDIKKATSASLQQGDLERAKQYVNFAQAIADQTDESEHYALVAWCHTTLHFNRNISEAVKYSNKVIQFYAKTGQYDLEGRALVGYASQLSQIGRLDEAEQAILRAKECLWNVEDYREWPTLYLNLACVQFYQARYEQMLVSAQQSEAIAQEYIHLYPDRADRYKYSLTRAIINQAGAALCLGKMEDAELRLNQALTIAVSYQWAETCGRARLNLARIYTFQGKLFVALKTLQQAETDFKIVQIDIELATVLLYQADIYQRLMMPIQGRASAARAADVLSQATVFTESVEAYLLAASISLTRREAKRARRYLDFAKSSIHQTSVLLQAVWQSYAAHYVLNPDHSSKEKALQQVDQAYVQLHDLGAVTQMLTVALIAVDIAARLEKSDIIQRYKTIIEQSQAHSLADLEQQACVGLGVYYMNALSYNQAYLYLRRAADILVHKREQMPVEELKAILVGGSTDIYTRLIEVAMLNDKSTHATEILIEAKGGIWLDLFSPAKIAPMRPEWTQTRAELAYWEEEARGSTESAHLKLCEKRINHAKEALTDMARAQQRKRIGQNTPNSVEVQGRLRPTQIILEYLVGSQQIWVCLISQKELLWLDLGPKQHVERNISRLNMLFKNLLYTSTVPPKAHLSDISDTRRQIAHSQLTNIQQVLCQLYAQLIEPAQSRIGIDSHISQLLVVPDSYLFELPWTALYDGGNYLGQQYDVALYPSSALLAFDDVGHGIRGEHIGHPYILGYQGDPPLQHLKNSLNIIHDIWPTAHKINPAQITDLHWEQVPQWLHIGAHGHVNRQTPLFSRLDLADGPLLLADIFNLNLHGCELVTLSACETGITPEQGGVLLALAGAFLCAGAKNVIASLWPVDDEATTILMSSFYNAYRTGISPQRALQSAQQALQRSGYAHPFYWAPFQVFARSYSSDEILKI